MCTLVFLQVNEGLSLWLAHHTLPQMGHSDHPLLEDQGENAFKHLHWHWNRFANCIAGLSTLFYAEAVMSTMLKFLKLLFATQTFLCGILSGQCALNSQDIIPELLDLGISCCYEHLE